MAHERDPSESDRANASPLRAKAPSVLNLQDSLLCPALSLSLVGFVLCCFFLKEMDDPSPNNGEQMESHETNEEPPTKKRVAQEESPTDQPTPAANGTPTINLTVKSQDGSQLFFRIKRDTRLFKLLLAFCERKQVDYRSMRFLYDGKRINGNQTPKRLRMEDGDEIDAMKDQFGGGCDIY